MSLSSMMNEDQLKLVGQLVADDDDDDWLNTDFPLEMENMNSCPARGDNDSNNHKDELFYEDTNEFEYHHDDKDEDDETEKGDRENDYNNNNQIEDDDDDEGLLEATKVNQVGYFDPDGVGYGYLYTKDNVQRQLTDESYKKLQLEMQYQYKLEQDQEEENEEQSFDLEGDEVDFDDPMNIPIFSVMDAYHAFTMKKRVEEANQQWNTISFESMEKRTIKVRFCDQVEFFQIGNDTPENLTDNDNNDIEFLTFNDLHPKNYDTPQAPVSTPVSSDSDLTIFTKIEAEINTPSQLTDKTLLLEKVNNSLLKCANNSVKKRTSIISTEKDKEGTETSKVQSKKVKKRRVKVQPSSAIIVVKGAITPTTTMMVNPKCNKKYETIDQDSSQNFTTLLSKEPTQASKLRNIIKVSKKSTSHNWQTSAAAAANISSHHHHHRDQKMMENLGGEAAKFVEIKLGNIIGAKNSFVNNNNNNNSKKIDPKSCKTNISLFPIPPEPPSISPILRSILDPPTLTMLAKSCNENSNVLKELKAQILKHKIQKSTLEHILNKKIINLIYTNNNNDNIDDSIVTISGCQSSSNNNNNKNYHQQTLSSKRKTRSSCNQSHVINLELGDGQGQGQGDKRRSLMTAAATTKSNYYCQVQETSKWASKPTFTPIHSLIKQSTKLRTAQFTPKTSKVQQQRQSPALEKMAENDKNAEKRQSRVQLGCQILSMEVNNHNMPSNSKTIGKLSSSPSATVNRKKKMATTIIPNSLVRSVKT